MDNQNETEKAEASSEEYSHHLPSPASLQAYNEVLPGMSESLLKMIGTEVAHRQEISAYREAEYQRYMRYGLFAGFGVTLSFLAAALWLVVVGQIAAGIILGSIDIVGLVGISTWGRRQEAEVREDRAVEERDPNEWIEESRPVPEELGALRMRLALQRQVFLEGLVSSAVKRQAQ